MPHKSHHPHPTRKTQDKENAQPQPPQESPPIGYREVGPLSVDGVEAHDLPDHGPGPIETEVAHESKRTLPQDAGTIDREGGLHASLDISDADQHGH